jgi:acyl carrier protein
VSDTLERLTPIFRDVFDRSDLNIGRADNSATIDGWDSLAHITLISAVEQEFHVRFALGELGDLKDIGDMIDLIERKSARK